MRTAPSLVLALAVVFSLGACVADAPVVLPDESPSSEPIFGSDEEALAAAEAAYGAFLKVSGEILADGGAMPDRLLKVATEEVLDSERESFELFAENGWRSHGISVLDSISLQSADIYAQEGEWAVTVYACVDVSSTDVFDVDGVSVVSPDRPVVTPFETAFVVETGSPLQLILAEKSVWTGDNFCV